MTSDICHDFLLASMPAADSLHPFLLEIEVKYKNVFKSLLQHVLVLLGPLSSSNSTLTAVTAVTAVSLL